MTPETAQDPTYNNYDTLETRLEAFQLNFRGMIPESLAKAARYGSRPVRSLKFAFEGYDVQIYVEENLGGHAHCVEDAEGNVFRPCNLKFDVSYPSANFTELDQLALFIERLSAVHALAVALTDRFGGLSYEFMSSKASREATKAKHAAQEFCVARKEELAKLRKGIALRRSASDLANVVTTYNMGKKSFKVEVLNGVVSVTRTA